MTSRRKKIHERNLRVEGVIASEHHRQSARTDQVLSPKRDGLTTMLPRVFQGASEFEKSATRCRR